MHVRQYQHTFVLTGLWGLVLLAGLFTVFLFGLVGLLAGLVRRVSTSRTGGVPQTQEQPYGDAGVLLRALWAVPGKVRIGTVTVHVGWIALSLAIAALVALLR